MGLFSNVSQQKHWIRPNPLIHSFSQYVLGQASFELALRTKVNKAGVPSVLVEVPVGEIETKQDSTGTTSYTPHHDQ